MEIGTRPYFLDLKYIPINPTACSTPSGGVLYLSEINHILDKPLEFGNKKQIEALGAYEALEEKFKDDFS